MPTPDRKGRTSAGSAPAGSVRAGGAKATAPVAESVPDDARELSRLRAVARKQGLKIRTTRADGASGDRVFTLVDGDSVVASLGSIDDLRARLTSRTSPRGVRRGAAIRGGDGDESMTSLLADHNGDRHLAPERADEPMTPISAEPDRDGASQPDPGVAGGDRLPEPSRRREVAEADRPDLRAASGAVEAREPCPRCGAPRLGAFRFCRTCGLDFEPRRGGPTVTSLVAANASSAPAPSREDKRPRFSAAVAEPRSRRSAIGTDGPSSWAPAIADAQAAAEHRRRTIAAPDRPPRTRGVGFGIGSIVLVIAVLLGAAMVGALTALVLR